MKKARTILQTADVRPARLPKTIGLRVQLPLSVFIDDFRFHAFHRAPHDRNGHVGIEIITLVSSFRYKARCNFKRRIEIPIVQIVRKRKVQALQFESGRFALAFVV